MSKLEGKSSGPGGGKMSSKQSTKAPKPGKEEEQAPPTEDSQVIILKYRVRQQDEDIAELKVLNEKSAKEVDKLKQQQAVLEREQLAAANELRAQAQEAKFRAEATTAKTQAVEKELEQERSTAVQREITLRKEMDAILASISSDNTSLKAQLEALADFSLIKDDMERDLCSQRQQIADMRLAHDREMAELHLRAHRAEEQCERVRSEALEREKAAGLDDNGDASDVVKLLQFNRKLVTRVKQAERDVYNEQQRAIEVSKKCMALKLELDALKQLQAAAVERCAQQMNAVVLGKAGAAALEQKTIELEEDKALAIFLQNELKLELEQSKNEVTKLQDQLNLAARQYKSLWQQYQRHVAEHSEVHSFLVSSIKMVREHITAGGGSPAPMGSPQSPQAHTPSTSKNKPSPDKARQPPNAHFAATLRQSISSAGGRVDVSQLTWPEREEVLRLMLAHINKSHASRECYGSIRDGASSFDNGGSCVTSSTGVEERHGGERIENVGLCSVNRDCCW